MDMISSQHRLNAHGFHFTQWQIASFFTALQTKGFVILSGISGTGKTKLAQYMAQALPKPIYRTPVEQSDVITITVQPYMPKYTKFIVPQAASQLYEPPPKGESNEILIRYASDENNCRIFNTVTSTGTPITLNLREGAAQWFRAFTPGDTLIVEPLWEEDDLFIGFHLFTEEEYQAQQAGVAEEGENWHFATVRPDWRDSKSLLGYYNPQTGTAKRFRSGWKSIHQSR